MKQFRLSAVLIAWILLGLLMLLYAVWMSDQAVLRYITFKAGAFDLGNMDQAIWNTLHGRPFQFTNHGSNWYGYPIRLAQHVEPIIFLLSLLYVFHADPRIIIIFQVLVLTAGALPVFLLTRRFVSVWPLLAPLMAVAYLLSPAVLSQNMFDFHPVSLVTALLLYAILALTYRRYAWFVVCCLLAAACKEEIPFVVALLGLLVMWKYHLPRLGLVLFVVGTAWSLFAFLVIEPHFNIGAQTNTFWYRYAALGSSPQAAIVNVLSHPWLLWTMYFTLDRVYYLINLLRITAFLALLAPEWLVPTLCSLAINLLSMQSGLHSGIYQYNAAIIPFIMLAAIHGTRRFTLLWYHWRGETKQLALLRETNLLMVPTDQRSDIQEAHRRSVARRMLFLPALRQRIQRYWQTLHKLIVKHTLIQRMLIKIRLNWIKCTDSFQDCMAKLAQLLPVSHLQWCYLVWMVGMIALNYFLMFPKFNTFWPDHQVGNREQHIAQLLAIIPPNAPVSAGGNINPHLSERQYITVFPELTVATMERGKTVPVQYVIVDLHNVAPEDKSSSTTFLNTLNWIQRSHQFRVLAQAEGVILLVRNDPVVKAMQARKIP